MKIYLHLKAAVFVGLCCSLVCIVGACNKPVDYDLEINDSNIVNIGSVKKKVLLVTIEGARGDLMENMSLHNIQSLAEQGVYCWDAASDTNTADRASWASLITGVHADKSGVGTDSYAGNNFSQYPSFFHRLKTQSGADGFRMVVLSSSSAINDSLIAKADVEALVQLPSDKAVQDSALNRLKDSAVDVLMVDYASVNQAGKTDGFTASSQNYVSALQKVDGYIGALITALQKRPSYNNEQWMVIVTSNHGGNAAGDYGGSSAQERNTFAIYSRPGLPAKQLQKADLNVPYEGTFPYFASGASAYTDNPAFHFADAQDFTVEFKIKTIGSTSDNPIIGNKNWASGSNTGWLIYMQSGNLRLNFKGSSGSRVDARNGPIINDDQWHHISVVFNRMGDMLIYDNGKFFVDGGSIVDQGNVDAGYPMVIGNDGTKNYGGNLRSYIADIRIWNKALTADEINQYAFKSSLDGHPEYNTLLAYWKADAGLGSNGKIVDESKAKVDLPVTGGLTWSTFSSILNPSILDPYATIPNNVDVSMNILIWMGLRLDAFWGLDGKLWILPQ